MNKILSKIVFLITIFFSLEFLLHSVYFFKNKSFMWQRGSEILDYNQHYFYKYKPYIINQMHGYPDKLGTDQYGFIYNFDKNRIIDQKNINIFLMGGSTVEGRGSSSNDKTIPSQLEACLKNNFNSIFNVINSGYSGYTVLQQINFYKYYLKENFNNSMDFVIFFDGFNDAYYSITNKDIGIEGVNHYKYKKYFEAQSTFSFKLDKFFSRYSGLYLLVSKIFITHDKKQELTLHENNISENTKKLSEQIQKFKLHLNRENIGFLHVIQPYLSSRNKIITTQEQNLIDDYVNRMDFNQNEYFYFLDNFFDKYISNNQINSSLDYSKIFLNYEGVLYYDTVHYNDQGNKIISEQICKDLSSQFKFKNYKR